MIDDGKVKEFTRAGCWASCHDDAIGMPSAAAGSDLTKYLGVSRAKLSRTGGGTNLKPEAELAALVEQGVFLALWQAKLAPGQDARAATRRSSTATAAFADGKWSVELSRPLAGGPKRKALVAGTTYTVAFAIHDDWTEHRFHHVSFEYTLSLDGGNADFVARKP